MWLSLGNAVVYLARGSHGNESGRNPWKQTLANWGPNSRFDLEAIFKPLIPKSSRSSIMITMNRVHDL